MTTIQEVKDLNKLILEELIGSLMTHELNMNQKKEEEVKKKKTLPSSQLPYMKMIITPKKTWRIMKRWHYSLESSRNS